MGRAAKWGRVLRLGWALGGVGLFFACTMPDYEFSVAPLDPAQFGIDPLNFLPT